MIKGMKMPKNCTICRFCVPEADPENGEMCMATGRFVPPCSTERLEECPLVEVPTPHGPLIDWDELSTFMYHHAFELDSADQRWDSGCWIRYQLFENAMKAIPTIIEAEEGEEDD